MFLFAPAELLSKTSIENTTAAEIEDNVATYEQEGTQYQHFKNTVGDADILSAPPALIKKLSNGSGSANNWWLRSPRIGSNNQFWVILPTGGSGYATGYNQNGVSFGFCV